MIIWTKVGTDGRPNEQRAQILSINEEALTEERGNVRRTKCIFVRFLGDGASRIIALEDICGIELTENIDLMFKYTGFRITS